MREITLPETKPASEWINGRALQKVSPRRKHARAQGRFFAALDAWAQTNDCGVVGTEWEFRIAPPGEVRRPLVPDVAWLSYARLPHDVLEETDYPLISPDVVVEVLSPGDKASDVEEKIRVYLAAGSLVVFLVDTDARTVTSRESENAAVFSFDDLVTHASLPGFVLRARYLFEARKPNA
ncbi:MAG TPA: Uma2 family endonuclease [Candidatus Eremiobacteraceae bacterium]|nr:Uma2 family endonuclease [Candidatus Eremiobacteraceae bacterium]